MTTLEATATEHPAKPHSSRSVTRRDAPTVARFLLGTVFFVFGLNGFLNFIPPPSGPIPEGAAAFGAAMMHTGYLFQLLKGTEVLAGSLLLANRFVPLALAVLAVLAVLVINIFAFHAFLAPAQIAIALVVVALELYLTWKYRGVFRPMLSLRATAE